MQTRQPAAYPAIVLGSGYGWKMLRLTPDALQHEIDAARNLRRLHLEMWDAVLKRYIGRFYRGGSDGEPTPENYPFSYLAFVLPQIVDRAPGIDVQARFDVADDPVAMGLRIAAERVMEEIGWGKLSRRIAVDGLFSFGASKLTLEGRGDHAGSGIESIGGNFQQMSIMPSRRRISPRRLLLDGSGVSCVEECRLVGDEYERDLEDVQQDERFDPEAVERLTADEERSARDDNPLSVSIRQDLDRRRIKLVDLYLPEQGRIMTLAEQRLGEPGAILRNERYYGPDEGPYQVWGAYLVPDQVYPISPVIATWEQFLELQDHATGAAVEAGSHKRIGIFNPGAKADAERITKAPSGAMVPVSDPNGVKDFEIGGTSPARIEYIGVLRERLDRAMGFSDAQRGQPNSDTATANQLAQSNSDLRIGWIRTQFEQFEAQDLRKLLYYLIYERSIRFQMVVDDKEQGQRYTATFQGGPWTEGGYINNQYVPPQRAMDLADFALSVRPGSMAKRDNAIEQKRAQDEIALAAQLSQTLAAYGLGINWTRLIDQYGEAFGRPNYSRVMLLDPQTGGMMGSPMPMPFGPQAAAQMQQPGQMMPMPGAQMPPRPAMGQGLGQPMRQMGQLMGQAQRVA